MRQKKVWRKQRTVRRSDDSSALDGFCCKWMRAFDDVGSFNRFIEISHIQWNELGTAALIVHNETNSIHVSPRESHAPIEGRCSFYHFHEIAKFFYVSSSSQHIRRTFFFARCNRHMHLAVSSTRRWLWANKRNSKSCFCRRENLRGRACILVLFSSSSSSESDKTATKVGRAWKEGKGER